MIITNYSSSIKFSLISEKYLPVETLASEWITLVGACARFASLPSKAPVARQAVAAACAPYTRFTVALATPGVAPGSLLSRWRRERTLRITPAA